MGGPGSAPWVEGTTSVRIARKLQLYHTFPVHTLVLVPSDVKLDHVMSETHSVGQASDPAPVVGSWSSLFGGVDSAPQPVETSAAKMVLVTKERNIVDCFGCLFVELRERVRQTRGPCPRP